MSSADSKLDVSFQHPRKPKICREALNLLTLSHLTLTGIICLLKNPERYKRSRIAKANSAPACEVLARRHWNDVWRSRLAQAFPKSLSVALDQSTANWTLGGITTCITGLTPCLNSRPGNRLFLSNQGLFITPKTTGGSIQRHGASLSTNQSVTWLARQNYGRHMI